MFAREATAILESTSSTAQRLLAIHDEIAEKRYRKALKRGRDLVASEAVSSNAEEARSGA
ncbi:MAG: hypothetical protein K2Y56_15795 [Methylobacterium sp.]|nr:hypothetical protein [Methylobacterium sp.]